MNKNIFIEDGILTLHCECGAVLDISKHDKEYPVTCPKCGKIYVIFTKQEKD